MSRSKAFSEHQEERKQELLKEHGCYVLKDIKGDITVNNPENYSVEYKVDDKIRHENIKFIIRVLENQRTLANNLKNGTDELRKLKETCKFLSKQNDKNDKKIVSCEATIKEGIVSSNNLLDREDRLLKRIKDYQKNEMNLNIIKEKGNIFQKLMLKILGL